MPVSLSKGGKLSDLTSAAQIEAGLSVNAPSGMTTDFSCFGLDEHGKLSDDRYFIFYNQKSSPCGSVKSMGPQSGDKEIFQINLSALPSSVRKLVFTISIDGEGMMSQIQQGYLRLLDKNTEVARFAFAGQDFTGEKALIVGELYFKDIWRFCAVGQGFKDGLNALLKHFGGEC